MDGGAWWAAVHGVAKSRIRLSDFTFTFHFHALEKEMATHSSVLAWRIPGMGKPDGLPSMWSHRIGHDWSDLAAAAEVGFWRRKWEPTPVFLSWEFHGQRSLMATGHGITKSWTRLTRLSKKWLIQVDVWQKPSQYSKVIILQLKKKVVDIFLL